MPKTFETNYGPSGPATVKVTPKTIIVKLDGDKYLEPFIFEKSSYEGVVVPGRCVARISSDTEALYGLRPLTGNFFVKFEKFGAKKDAAPLPRLVVEKSGISRKNNKPYKIPEHYEFTALLTVMRGDWEGATIPINLTYHFRQYKDTNITEQLLGTAKSKKQLDDFLIHAGLDLAVDILPWSENILPELEARLQKADVEFLVNLDEKGYVDAISPAPDMGTKKAKKKARK